jgi:hypothetical protein
MKKHLKELCSIIGSMNLSIEFRENHRAQLVNRSVGLWFSKKSHGQIAEIKQKLRSCVERLGGQAQTVQNIRKKRVTISQYLHFVRC